jgi:hypothetical protein
MPDYRYVWTRKRFGPGDLEGVDRRGTACRIVRHGRVGGVVRIETSTGQRWMVARSGLEKRA